MQFKQFPTPQHDRYFEDYEPGATYDLGTFSLSEQEIVEFARRFDPQPFHIDPEAAKHSAFGGLIASGWHTGSCMMRKLVDVYLSSVAGMGSPGLDNIRWTHPVRPGDVLAVRVTVQQARRSESKPDRGLVHALMEVVNQDGTLCMAVNGISIIRCRSPQ